MFFITQLKKWFRRIFYKKQDFEFITIKQKLQFVNATFVIIGLFKNMQTCFCNYYGIFKNLSVAVFAFWK